MLKQIRWHMGGQERGAGERPQSGAVVR